MRKAAFVLGGSMVLLAASVARATDYNDVTTDLSNAFGSPTLLTLTSGPNLLTGRSGTQSGIDRDYFRFVVPTGFRLTAINLVSTDTPSVTFLGVENGTSFTDPTATSLSQLLGYVHFGQSLVGTDILDNMGAASGTQGFTGPLGAGNYSFWLQENGSAVVNYQLSFVLTPNPTSAPALPGLWGAALALALIGAAIRRPAILV